MKRLFYALIGAAFAPSRAQMHLKVFGVREEDHNWRLVTPREVIKYHVSVS